jgi:predicted HicB family RNase H-like nuclease
MRYKGYSATMIELDEDTGTIHGRVALEHGMATFEGATVSEAARAFRDSVDDYLAMCAEHGIEPERPAAVPATSGHSAV